MKYLENLHIEKFRGLRNLELKNLGQINLLVGINNCGKTSILEALSIYCMPLDITVWLNTLNQRNEMMKNSGRSSVLESLKWLFPQSEEGEKNQISISSTGEFYLQKLIVTSEEIEGLLLSNREQQIRKGLELDIKVYTLQGNLFQLPEYQENIELWENELRPKKIKVNKEFEKLPIAIVTPASHRSELRQFQLLSEANFDNFKSDVIDLLNYIDGDIIDLEILLSPPSTFASFNIYIKHKKLGFAPIHTFGDGVRRLIHIALQLARAKGGILLIDEIESTIHTEIMIDSFSWIINSCKKMDIQLFATTHSLEVIDKLLSTTESSSDLVFYRLEPKKLQTKVIRHDWNRLKILREELGQEVRW